MTDKGLGSKSVVASGSISGSVAGAGLTGSSPALQMVNSSAGATTPHNPQKSFEHNIQASLGLLVLNQCKRKHRGSGQDRESDTPELKKILVWSSREQSRWRRPDKEQELTKNNGNTWL